MPGTGHLFLSCWPVESHGLSRTLQAIAVAPGCPPELDGKTLLLKTLHTGVTGHEEIRLKASSLLTSAHSARRFDLHCQGTEVFNSLTKL